MGRGDFAFVGEKRLFGASWACGAGFFRDGGDVNTAAACVAKSGGEGRGQ